MSKISVRICAGALSVTVVVTGASVLAASTATVLVAGGAAATLAAIGFGLHDRRRRRLPHDNRRQ